LAAVCLAGRLPAPLLKRIYIRRDSTGEFESGLAARWLGAVPAVALGGIGTIIVTLLGAGLFPELRRADQLKRKQS